jgi:chloride channel 3/4/5
MFGIVLTDHGLLQMIRDVEVIRQDRENTVESLRDQLQAVLCAGHDDTGFPILRQDKHDEGLRMVGYIGANELEHALSMLLSVHNGSERLNSLFEIGIVAEEAKGHVRFHTTHVHNIDTSSVASEEQDGIDPFDFSVYMDKVKSHCAVVL